MTPLMQTSALWLLVVLLLTLWLAWIVQRQIARYRCRKHGHRWNADGSVCKRCGHVFDLPRWRQRTY